MRTTWFLVLALGALGACSGQRTWELEGSPSRSDVDSGNAPLDTREAGAEQAHDAAAELVDAGLDATMSAPLDASRDPSFADAGVADAGLDIGLVDAAVSLDASGDADSADASACQCAVPVPSCASTEGSGVEQLYSCDHLTGCINEPAETRSCARADEASCDSSTGALEIRSARCKDGQGCSFEVEEVDSCTVYCSNLSTICGGGCETDPETGAARCLPCRRCTTALGGPYCIAASCQDIVPL